MPKVPYQGLADVAPRPIAQNRQEVGAANANAFGAPVGEANAAFGQAIGKASDVTFSIVNDMKKRDNEREARDALTALSMAQRAAAYGDGTPENPGYLNMKGHAAVEGYQKAVKDVTDLRKKTSQSLSSNEVRDLFDPRSQQQTDDYIGRFSNYSYDQRYTADKTSLTSQKVEAVNMAASDPLNDQNLEAARHTATVSAAKLAQLDGLDKDTADQQVAAADTEVLLGAMNSIIQRSNVAEAQKFYEKHKGSIDGKIQTKIEGELKTAANQERITTEHAATVARLEETAREEAEYGTITDGILDGTVDKDAINNSHLTGAHKQSAFRFMETVTQAGGKQNLKGDGGVTFMALMKRIHLPFGDPNRITNRDQLMQSVYDLKLAPSGPNSLDDLSKEINIVTGNTDASAAAKAFNNWVSAAEKLIVLNDMDVHGKERHAQWFQQASQEWNKNLAEGLATPQQMGDPNDPHYILRNIGQFQKDQATVVNEYIERSLGNQGNQTTQTPQAPVNSLPASTPAAQGAKPTTEVPPPVPTESPVPAQPAAQPAAPATTPAPAPTPSPAASNGIVDPSQMTREQVLDAVNKGTITPAQAKKRLAQLRKQ